MRRRVLIGVLASALSGCGSDVSEPRAEATIASPSATIAPGAAAYLNQILDLMQANSINRSRIDWPSFRNSVLAEAGAAADIPQLNTAIRLAIQQLGDGHSFFQTAAGLFFNQQLRDCRAPAPITFTAPSTIGVVRIRSFSGTNEQAVAYAQELQQTLASFDGRRLDGWIVDLRGNGGGNMWPMLAGVGPILGSGPLGYFVYESGAQIPWDYRDGAAFSGATAAVRLTSPYPIRQPLPRIAVLTNTGVASSGEAILISFRERANTRTFGTATCGLSTSNQTYTLRDGAQLFLTTSTMADRTGRLYGNVVHPDELITDQQQAIDRAIAWLQTGR